MRRQIESAKIVDAFLEIEEKVAYRLRTKGRGVYASPHEAEGIIDEEHDELVDELRANDRERFRAELIDIAVACVIAMASDNGQWDWLEEAP